MPTAVLTSNGLSKISHALSHNGTVDVSYFKIGSSIITPDASMTDVTGLVYTGLTSQMSISSVGTNSVQFAISLFSTVGPFTVGNIGLFCTDGTMFAIAALDAAESKTVTVGSVQGSILVYSIITTFASIGTVISLSINAPIAVTSVGLTSSDGNIVVTNSPITTSGDINIRLANDFGIVGDLDAGGDLTVANVATSHLTTVAGSSLSNQLVVSNNITSTGSDANVSINIVPKGAGSFLVKNAPVISADSVATGSTTVTGTSTWFTQSFTLASTCDVFLLFTGDRRTAVGPDWAQLYLDGVAVPGALSGIGALGGGDGIFGTVVIQLVVPSLAAGPHTVHITYTTTTESILFYDRGGLTVIPIVK